MEMRIPTGKLIKRGTVLALISSSSVVFADSALVYLQVNRGVLHSNDNHEHRTYFVDNDVSSSRFGFSAEKTFAPCMSFGTKLESLLEHNSTSVVNQASYANGFNFNLNVADVFLSTQIGKLTLGHGDMASDGISSKNMGGCDNVASANAAWASGLYFHKKDDVNYAGFNAADVSVGQFYGHMDGVDNKNRVRYDSPNFYGLGVSASHAVTSFDKSRNARGYISDMALNYTYSISGVNVAASLGGYRSNKDELNENLRVRGVSGSVGVLHEATGINASFAFGSQDESNATQKRKRFNYFQIGKKSNWSRFGETAIVIESRNGKHAVSDDDKAKFIGLAVSQKFDKVNTDVYLGARRFKLNRETVEYDKLNAFILGAKINLSSPLM